MKTVRFWQETRNVLAGNIKIARTFNSYFESVTDYLELFNWSLQLNIFYEKVQNIVKNFYNRSSIIKNKEIFKLNKNISFQCVSKATVRKAVKNLPSD